MHDMYLTNVPTLSLFVELTTNGNRLQVPNQRTEQTLRRGVLMLPELNMYQPGADTGIVIHLAP